MRNAVERIAQTRKAIRLADWIRIVFGSQRQRNLQMRLNAPFILGVEAQSIKSDRFGWPAGIRLLIGAGGTVIETRQVREFCQGNSCRVAPRRVIGYVIAAEVDPELDVMLTL